MKKFIEEFKVFISRGSVVDLAVGVIIGSAFTAIVNSLVNDLIMPIISLITGGISFENWFICLDGGSYATLADATAAGASVLAYGSFLNAVINFLLIALVIFTMVRGINKIRDKRDAIAAAKKAAEPATTKECPFCFSTIPIKASKCPCCTADLPAKEA